MVNCFFFCFFHFFLYWYFICGLVENENVILPSLMLQNDFLPLFHNKDCKEGEWDNMELISLNECNGPICFRCNRDHFCMTKVTAATFPMETALTQGPMKCERLSNVSSKDCDNMERKQIVHK